MLVLTVISLVDAVKETFYQKLIQRICELERTTWQTVQHYAIIDTGIAFPPDVAHASTGYKGDRCGLVLRQAHSRFNSEDDVVFYSVAQRKHLLSDIGASMRMALAKYGLTSEQLPRILCEDMHESNLEGDWNIQGDSQLLNMVDFSHFIVLPGSRLHHAWKISDKAVREALLLGGAHLCVCSHDSLRRLAFPELSEKLESEQERAAQAALENEQQRLNERWSEVGIPNRRKPTYSWTWFLETDDSEVARYSNEKALQSECNAETLQLHERLEEWLPRE